MGMPVITSSTTTREQAITDVLQSVALQEAALSHILNAEGEKLQKIFSMDVSQETILAANRSVESMVDAAAQLAAMKAQMDAAEPAASAAPAYQCSQCGWIPEDPSNLPKFCPQCGNVLTDQE